MWKQRPELGLSSLHSSTLLFYRSRCNALNILLKTPWRRSLCPLYCFHLNHLLKYLLFIPYMLASSCNYFYFFLIAKEALLVLHKQLSRLSKQLPSSSDTFKNHHENITIVFFPPKKENIWVVRRKHQLIITKSDISNNFSNEYHLKVNLLVLRLQTV